MKAKYLSVLLVLATLIFSWDVSAFDVTPGQSGAWVDPNDDGEGWFLEIISDTQAVVFWFTYDENRKQVWMIGVGNIVGDKITFNNLLAPHGGKFGPDFDPDDVQYPTWGTLEFVFSGCSNATVSYSGPPEFGNNSYPVVRLTSLWGVSCTGSNTAGPSLGSGFLNSGFSGPWGDVEHDGEGFVVEILSETAAVIIWFTFDRDGNPAWMLDVASINGATMIADNFLISSDGIFGPDTNPNDHVLKTWGQAVFTFGSCGFGAMRYLPPDEFAPESTQLLYRIASISGLECEFLATTHSIDSTLTVAQNILIDGDVNNPDQPEVSNDLEGGTPQQLASPARVIGFAAAEGTGKEGDRFESEIDEWDAYLVPIKQSESISLEISDWDESDVEKVDLDLYLVNLNDLETVVDSSLNTDQHEYVTANQDGNYLVVVNAFSGQSNYLLQSGQSTPLSFEKMSVTSDFQPNKIMASLKPQINLQVSRGDISSKARIESFEKQHTLARVEENPTGDVLYEVSPNRVDTLPPHPLTKLGYGSITAEEWRVIRTAKKLSANSDYRWAGPNYIQQQFKTPNDPAFTFQWHYLNIRLPQAWDVTTGSDNVVVAVLDSGVYNHPDLAGNIDYSLGYDFVSNLFESGDFDGRDPDASDPGPYITPLAGYQSHGTHVAGTIGAISNNSIGVAGVNWDVTVMPVRVLGTNRSGSCWEINEGLKWAGRLANISGMVPSRKADIINLSLGSAVQCPGRQEIVNQLTSNGSIVVAAAGNQGNSVPQYPASLQNVISVSATTAADGLAPYSTFGSGVDIAAPGGDMEADLNSDDLPDGVLSSQMAIESGSSTKILNYWFSQGTSMASPHVAGVAALMKSVYPELGPNEFLTALSSGEITTDLAQNGPTNKDSQYGYGRIDALKAVQWAVSMAQGGSSETFLTSSVYALNFGSNQLSVDFEIGKSGSGGISVVGGGVTEPWLSLFQVSVDPNGLGTYRLIVDRNGLLNGSYSGWAGIQDSKGSWTYISAAMRVGAEAQGQAGRIYALLLDDWTIQNVKQWSGDQSGATYQIHLPDNPPGGYYLLVGSDIDNDGSICDAGEFCQYYPTLSSVIKLEIGDSDLQLGAFRLGFPSSGSLSSNATGSGFTPEKSIGTGLHRLISRAGRDGFPIGR